MGTRCIPWKKGSLGRFGYAPSSEDPCEVDYLCRFYEISTIPGSLPTVEVDGSVVWPVYTRSCDCPPACLSEAEKVCVEEFLEEQGFITESEVLNFINLALESQTVAAAGESACCPTQVLDVYGPNGGRTVVADYDKDGFSSLHLQASVHVYQGEPDRAAARKTTGFYPDTNPDGSLPIACYAATDDGAGGPACITHIGVDGKWLKLGADQVEKCYALDEPVTLPITYTAADSVWEIKGVEYKLPVCESVETFSAVYANTYEAQDISGDPVASGSQNVDLNVFFTPPVIGGIAPISGEGLYVAHVNGYAGNGGTVNLADVSTITVCFEASGGGFGFGLVDAYGNVANNYGGASWIPSTTVTGPGQHVETAGQTIISSSQAGSWEATYSIPGYAIGSNSVLPAFYGLGDTEISSINVKVGVDGGGVCTIDTLEELADVLTQVSPDCTTWFESCGNVAAWVKKGC